MVNKYEVKNIIFDIGGVLFSYKNKNDVYYAVENPQINPFTPIQSGLEILNNCFNQKNEFGERAHRLFILSNWNAGPFNLLLKHFPETFKLFDGIVISGNVGWRKPDTRIYHHLIRTYNINPLECIFIDDQIENVETAQYLGMLGIFCSSHEEVNTQLNKYGILKK